MHRVINLEPADKMTIISNFFLQWPASEGSHVSLSERPYNCGTDKSPHEEGDYLVTRIESSKFYQLRLINLGANNALRVPLDNH